jgi:hypothetical protein
MSAFIDACYGKKTAFTPVWFMRQAGRSFPEYRKLKEKYDILTLARTGGQGRGGGGGSKKRGGGGGGPVFLENLI